MKDPRAGNQGSIDLEIGILRGGPDEREVREVETDAARARPLSTPAGFGGSEQFDTAAGKPSDEIVEQTIGQALTGLSFEVSYLSRQANDETQEIRGQLDKIARMIDSTIGSVTAITGGELKMSTSNRASSASITSSIRGDEISSTGFGGM